MSVILSACRQLSAHAECPPASPLSGWYADRGGTIVSTVVCLVGSLPFWCLLVIRSHLAYFITMFALLSKSVVR